jgi:hypothetical protein
MRALRVRMGTWVAVGHAMGVSGKTIRNAMWHKQRPGTKFAVRIARLAGVPIGDVLSGAFPKPGACLMCGR